jgi:hypothetical protein
MRIFQVISMRLLLRTFVLRLQVCLPAAGLSYVPWDGWGTLFFMHGKLASRPGRMAYWRRLDGGTVMCSYDDEQVARVCHEANRALQYIQGDPCPSLPWDCETAETRQSAAEGVRAVRQDHATARGLHESWRRFKAGHGWVYGPVKDPDAKTHPCMVPYDDLPPEQQDKDRLFHAVVTALSAAQLR